MYLNYYLHFRSATYARRASNILNMQNILSSVVRLPQSLTDTGCGYAVKIRSDLDIAINILEKSGLQFLNIYEKIGTEYREVTD